MTPAELEALARRAVACPKWQWLPGMLTTDGVRVIGLYATGKMAGYTPNSNRFYFVDGSIPDLRDPATVGCLLDLVREAHDNRELVTAKYHELRGWTVCTHSFEYEILPLFNPDEESGIFCDSEAAALVEALEVAP
jgi:hypothetical protein